MFRLLLCLHAVVVVFCMSASHFIDDSVNMSISFQTNEKIEYTFTCLLLFVDVGNYLMYCAPNFFY